MADEELLRAKAYRYRVPRPHLGDLMLANKNLRAKVIAQQKLLFTYRTKVRHLKRILTDL